ncbi:MAG: preprotein translocase subunit YajC [Gammaproteobacteria bacterium]
MMLSETAWAQAAAGGGESAWTSFLPLVLIMAVFYFLLIRPQQKRAKAHRNMLAALAVGDEVLTSGGIYGRVVKITENFVVLETGKTQIPFQKQSIQSLLPAGSLEKI